MESIYVRHLCIVTGAVDVFCRTGLFFRYTTTIISHRSVVFGELRKTTRRKRRRRRTEAESRERGLGGGDEGAETRERRLAPVGTGTDLAQGKEGSSS